MTVRTSLAVFDLDGTLVRGDSLLPFLLSYARRHGHYGVLPAFPVVCGLYVCKLLSDRTAKELIIRAVCGAQALHALGNHAEWFCDTWLPANLRPRAVERLRFHQRAGHRVILLSASPDLYVPVIARRLGIPEVICTKVETKHGYVTGRLQGENCKGTAKLRLLQSHLGIQRPPPNSFAYGDRPSDDCVLNWVASGYLLNRKSGVFEPVASPISQASANWCS
jgi:HAD superfamily hydrolase (TIGR01490 family)